MVFQNDILAGAAGAGGGYTIDQSIRFNDNDSAYLSRTSGSADAERKFASTSVWLKRSNLTSRHTIYSVNPAGSTGAANQITMVFENSGTNGDCITYNNGAVNRQSTSVYRDVSAWYHLCQIFDTSQATAADRVKTYINGALLTDINIGQDFSLNSNTAFGQNSVVHYLGRGGSTQYFDGYMAEVVFTVGQTVAVSDFGEYNDDGVWIPKEYTGSYGTNGFYITGEDSADLGADYSGNSNDFTSSGLTSDDQVTDTPTENYATLNPLDDATGYTTPLISNGNLDVDDRTGNAVRGNFGFKQGDGKFVYEVNITTLIGSMDLGWSAAGVDLWAVNGPELMYEEDANKLVSANSSSTPTRSAYGASYTSGDVIRVETDFDGSVIEFFKNGTSQGTIDFSGMNDGTFYFPACYCNRVDAEFNFGQQPFIGTPTAGYKALSTANLPGPAIKDGSKYFQTTLYTGDGNQTQTITQSENSTFNPDFLWIKNRSNAYSHNLNDAVRGYTGASPATAADVKVLASDVTDREGLGDTITTAQQRGFVQASTSDGFIVNKGTAGSQDGYYTNANAHTYAAWQWLAGNGTASNTDGSITSTVSANTTAGFSIVRAASMASGTIGHGLSQAPDMVIGRMQSEVFNWWVWHQGLSGGTYSMKLNDTTAQAAVSTVYTAEPTSSVINVGSSWTSGNPAIFYCFHEVEGFSKFGKYTGNGSADGSFIWCGFKPAFVVIKCSSVANSWTMYDTARQTYNPDGRYILAESSAAEVASTTVEIDILSNGFKARDDQNNINGSGRTYIFMAFAEHPFGGDGVAPVPAR